MSFATLFELSGGNSGEESGENGGKKSGGSGGETTCSNISRQGFLHKALVEYRISRWMYCSD